MINLVLNRLRTGSFGTPGILIEDDWPWCVALEDPWNDNVPFKSCISVGVYQCLRVKSELVKKITHGAWDETFEVQKVAIRENIRFHPGNTIEDTQGCILLGRWFGDINGFPGIKDSVKAFEDFMKRLKGQNEFTLTVIFN